MSLHQDTPQADIRLWRRLSRRALVLSYAINALLCVGVAWVLTRISDLELGPTVVYSLAIGMSIMTLVVGFFSLMDRYGVRAEGLGFVGRIVGAGVLSLPGYLIGSLIAHALLGRPLLPVILPIPGLHNNSIVGLLLASTIGTILFSAFQFIYRRNAELRLDGLQASRLGELALRQAADSRLALLRAQVDPHMLFNTLATVRALVRADPPAAQQMLDRLIDFYRATLSTSQDPLTTVGREFAMLEDYLALMQVRLGPRLSYDLTLGASTDAVTLPALLLQPLVENAIRHAIEPSKQGGRLQVDSRLDADQLHLRVQDSGIGISDIALARADELLRQTGGVSGTALGDGSGGMGLGLLAERLHSTYGAKARFAVSRPAQGGTRIDIWLPVQATPAAQAALRKTS